MSLKNGICHNCGSHEVYMDASNPVNNDSNRVDLGFRISGFFTTNHVHTRTYVCTKCGLVERYATNPRALAMIPDHWPRVED